MKTNIIIPIIALFTIGAALFGSQTFAYDSTNRDTIIQKLSQKFGVSESEVQSVFEEQREEKQKQMQFIFEQNLNNAVSSGEITEEQKQLILTKHNELKTQMENQRKELETWADQNNIDLKYLKFGHMGFKGGMMRMR